jgi:CO/xanthine dehydrogenase Mo-binding subunit
MSLSTIGRSRPRVDGAAKVTGVTRFAADVPLPGLRRRRAPAHEALAGQPRMERAA